MKSFCGQCSNMNKEDISWVVGEAIHFAYIVENYCCDNYGTCEIKIIEEMNKE